MKNTDEIREGLRRLREDRLGKLNDLKARGIDPYPPRFDRRHRSLDVKESFERGELEGAVSLAGRVMAMRDHGKSCFLDIEDAGGRIQTYFKKDELGEESYSIIGCLDIGDFIGVIGTMFRTRRGEITLHVESFQVLSKSLRPPPIVKVEVDQESGRQVVHDSFSDKELRFRQRYLDLMVNREVREKFRIRSEIVSRMREYLVGRDYLEVETPVLQPIYGGAFARPFKTFHNALGIPLYLRIADELYLKRLVIGGFERVFEFSKDFRNEGIDRLHNPEFTMLELYAAFADYSDMMDLLEDMLYRVSIEIVGKPELVYGGNKISFTPPFRRIRFFESVSERIGRDIRSAGEEELRGICEDRGMDVADKIGRGKLLEELFDEVVEPDIVDPTFVIDYPVEISPLAKNKPGEPDVVERFELIVCGGEIANAFSELNDPIEQRERFEAQMKLKESGDEEAQVLDEDFLRAMEYGMPPTGGMGIGVDRVVMIFTDLTSIREVILFPQMRPEQGGDRP